MTAAPAPRLRWYHVRRRTLAGLATALGLILAAAWFTMIRMPGTSFAGPVAPLGPDLAPLRDALAADVAALAEGIGERSVFRPESLARAADRVESRLRECGFVPRREPFFAVGQDVCNVVADVPGGERASEIVIVGAHYDTVRGTPGANDNATGVAALLALARDFADARPARTLRFVAFTTEEPPCFRTDAMGSRVHARGCRERGEDVVAMIALETLGCFRDAPGSQDYPIRGLTLLYPDRGDFVTFVGDTGAGGLVRTAVGAFRGAARIPSEGAAFPLSVPGVGWSDHESFRLEGFPALMVTDTAIFRDGKYHCDGDRADRVDVHRLSLAVEGLRAVVRRLAAGD